MPFVRPNGVMCSGYVYPDKKNTFEKLKDFLFNNNSGRTDVVFLASAATAYEPNQHKHTTNPLTYHYTGGLIDGISKAIIQGSATRSPRPMYATGVQFAYTCNKIPGFDRWNSATWLTPNTTGVGGYLTGCSTVYDSYYYYKNALSGTGDSTNSNTGLHFIAFNSSASYQYFDEFDTGNFINLNPYQLWAYSFNDPNDLAINSSSKAKKQSSSMYLGLQIGALPNSNRDTALSTTDTFNATFTFTPEQPQRFWDRENSWYISDTATFPIGIAYIDNTDTISEIFSDATTYGYIPSGMVVGQNVTAAKALLAVGKLKVLTMDAETNLKDETNTPLPSRFNWFPLPSSSTEYRDELLSQFSGKKILTRFLTLDEIISIRSLNISANNSAITNYGAWKNVDGFRYGGYIVFRSPWANPETLEVGSTQSTQTLLTNKVMKKFGLATSTDGSVSTWQAGLPYLFEWGNRPVNLSTNAWDLIDWGISRATANTSSPSTTTQIPGFPRLLSTIAPVGFFALNSAADSAKIASAAYTKYLDRGIVIKPNLGSFFNSINTGTGGAKQATSKVLTKAEKDASFGMFSSSRFKYCVNSYNISKYSVDTIGSSSLIKLTAHTRTDATSAFTLAASSSITQTNPVIANTTRRSVQRFNNLLPVDLSSNSNYTIHEIRLGFLGKGLGGTSTNGDLLITTHFGFDSGNQNGIAFSKLDTSYSYRSGDAGYQNSTLAGGRSATYNEFFKAIYERQTSATFGARSDVTPKLVIMVEIGVWESANPNFSYNGVNTWTYLVDKIPLTGPSSNGVYGGDYSFNSIMYIFNAALMAGFTRDNIIICFYTPSLLTTTSIPSNGSLSGVNYSTVINEQELIGDKNRRATFIRASETFVNNGITFRGGLYTPTLPEPPLVFNGVANTIAKNSLYLNFSSMTGLTSILNNIDTYESSWYDATDDSLNYRYYSEEGSLAIGSWAMDYISQATSSTYFVPIWLHPFSKMLNYTTDPVSGADLSLVTVSQDKNDIEPYLVQYDLLCDQNNTQAKRTLSKFKHKTLQ